MSTCEWDMRSSFVATTTGVSAELAPVFEPIRPQGTLPIDPQEGLTITTYNHLAFANLHTHPGKMGSFACEFQVREHLTNDLHKNVHYLTLGYYRGTKHQVITVGRAAGSTHPILGTIEDLTTKKATHWLHTDNPLHNMRDNKLHTLTLVYHAVNEDTNKLQLYAGDAHGEHMELVCDSMGMIVRPLHLLDKKLFLGTSCTPYDPSWGGTFDLCQMSLPRLRMHLSSPKLPISLQQGDGVLRDMQAYEIDGPGGTRTGRDMLSQGAWVRCTFYSTLHMIKESVSVGLTDLPGGDVQTELTFLAGTGTFHDPFVYEGCLQAHAPSTMHAATSPPYYKITCYGNHFTGPLPILYDTQEAKGVRYHVVANSATAITLALSSIQDPFLSLYQLRYESALESAGYRVEVTAWDASGNPVGQKAVWDNLRVRISDGAILPTPGTRAILDLLPSTPYTLSAVVIKPTGVAMRVGVPPLEGDSLVRTQDKDTPSIVFHSVFADPSDTPMLHIEIGTFDAGLPYDLFLLAFQEPLELDFSTLYTMAIDASNETYVGSRIPDVEKPVYLETGGALPDFTRTQVIYPVSNAEAWDVTISGEGTCAAQSFPFLHVGDFPQVGGIAIYRRENTTWSPVQMIYPETMAADRFFGDGKYTSFSHDGNFLVTSDANTLVSYQWNGTQYVFHAVVGDKGTRTCPTLSGSGEYLVTAHDSSGTAIYRRNGAQWDWVQSLVVPGIDIGYATDITFDASYVVVSFLDHAASSGACVFQKDNQDDLFVWNSTVTVPPRDTGVSWKAGRESVRITEDGRWMILASLVDYEPGEGFLHIFHRETVLDAWEPTQVLHGGPNGDSFTSPSIGITDDATKIIVGSWDAGPQERGEFRVYERHPSKKLFHFAQHLSPSRPLEAWDSYGSGGISRDGEHIVVGNSATRYLSSFQRTVPTNTGKLDFHTITIDRAFDGAGSSAFLYPSHIYTLYAILVDYQPDASGNLQPVDARGSNPSLASPYLLGQGCLEAFVLAYPEDTVPGVQIHNTNTRDNRFATIGDTISLTFYTQKILQDTQMFAQIFHVTLLGEDVTHTAIIPSNSKGPCTVSYTITDLAPEHDHFVTFRITDSLGATVYSSIEYTLASETPYANTIRHLPFVDRTPPIVYLPSLQVQSHALQGTIQVASFPKEGPTYPWEDVLLLQNTLVAWTSHYEVTLEVKQGDVVIASLVYRDHQDISPLFLGSQTAFQFQGLSENTAYDLVVSAIDGAGNTFQETHSFHTLPNLEDPPIHATIHATKGPKDTNYTMDITGVVYHPTQTLQVYVFIFADASGLLQGSGDVSTDALAILSILAMTSSPAVITIPNTETAYQVRMATSYASLANAEKVSMLELGTAYYPVLYVVDASGNAYAKVFQAGEAFQSVPILRDFTVHSVDNDFPTEAKRGERVVLSFHTEYTEQVAIFANNITLIGLPIPTSSITTQDGRIFQASLLVTEDTPIGFVPYQVAYRGVQYENTSSVYVDNQLPILRPFSTFQATGDTIGVLITDAWDSRVHASTTSKDQYRLEVEISFAASVPFTPIAPFTKSYDNIRMKYNGGQSQIVNVSNKAIVSTFFVTVGPRTQTGNTEANTEAEAFFMNGVESPTLTLLAPATTYTFLYADANDKAINPLRFYRTEDKAMGALTELDGYLDVNEVTITFTPQTPGVTLYYQSASGDGMGSDAHVIASASERPITPLFHPLWENVGYKVRARLTDPAGNHSTYQELGLSNGEDLQTQAMTPLVVEGVSTILGIHEMTVGFHAYDASGNVPYHVWCKADTHPALSEQTLADYADAHPAQAFVGTSPDANAPDVETALVLGDLQGGTNYTLYLYARDGTHTTFLRIPHQITQTPPGSIVGNVAVTNDKSLEIHAGQYAETQGVLEVPVSASFAIWFATTTSFATLWDLGDPAVAGGRRSVQVTPEGLIIEVGDGHARTLPGVYYDGTWHHLVVAFHPDELHVWIDGNATRFSALLPLLPLSPVSSPFRIGEHGTLYVDEVAIFHRTLTAEDIPFCYAEGSLLSGPGNLMQAFTAYHRPIAWWRFRTGDMSTNQGRFALGEVEADANYTLAWSTSAPQLSLYVPRAGQGASHHALRMREGMPALEVDLETSLASPFTCSLWVYLENPIGERVFVSMQDLEGNECLRIGISSTMSAFSVSTSIESVVGEAILEKTWHHIALTIQGDGPYQVQLYQDGACTQTSEFATLSLWRILRIGAGTGGTAPCYGILDDLALFQTAFEDTTLQALYHDGTPGNVYAIPLVSQYIVAWWRFEHSLVDSGPHAYVLGGETHMEYTTKTPAPPFQVGGSILTTHSLWFDGIDEYCQTTYPLDVGDACSVSFWYQCKYPESALPQTLASWTTRDGAMRALVLMDHTLYFERKGEKVPLQHAISADATYHVVVCEGDGVVHAWVDGENTLSDAQIISLVVTEWQYHARLTLGSKPGGKDAFAGSIDHVAIFDHVLDASAVPFLFAYATGVADGPADLQAAFSGVYQPLVWYPLEGDGKNHGSGGSTYDLTCFNGASFVSKTYRVAVETATNTKSLAMEGANQATTLLSVAHSTLSVSWWFLEKGFTSLMPMWSMRAAENLHVHVYVDSTDSLKLTIAAPNTIYPSYHSYPAGPLLGSGWHHAVVTIHEDTSVNLYLDGKHVQETTTMILPIRPITQLCLGGNGTLQCFQGCFREFVVWDGYRLHAQEVTALYHEGVPADPRSIAPTKIGGYWPLETHLGDEGPNTDHTMTMTQGEVSFVADFPVKPIPSDFALSFDQGMTWTCPYTTTLNVECYGAAPGGFVAARVPVTAGTRYTILVGKQGASGEGGISAFGTSEAWFLVAGAQGAASYDVSRCSSRGIAKIGQIQTHGDGVVHVTTIHPPPVEFTTPGNPCTAIVPFTAEVVYPETWLDSSLFSKGVISESSLSLALDRDVTISFWFKTVGNETFSASPIHNTGGARRARQIYVGANDPMTVQMHAEGVLRYIGNVPLTSKPNEWTHCAITYQNTVASVITYVDGRQYGQCGGGNPATLYTPVAKATDVWFYSQGLFADYAIFSGVLDAYDIRWLATNPAMQHPKYPQVVAHWDFADMVSENEYADRSGHGRTMTMTPR